MLKPWRRSNFSFSHILALSILRISINIRFEKGALCVSSHFVHKSLFSSETVSLECEVASKLSLFSFLEYYYSSKQY